MSQPEHEQATGICFFLSSWLIQGCVGLAGWCGLVLLLQQLASSGSKLAAAKNFHCMNLNMYSEYWMYG
jgi:hypothetical protein